MSHSKDHSHSKEKKINYIYKSPSCIKKRTTFTKKKPTFKKGGGKQKAQWTDQALNEAMVAIDEGYQWEEVCTHYGIPKTSLRDNMSGKTKSRNMNPSPILTKEEQSFLHFMKDMVELEHPLNTSQLKAKVATMTQSRMTPFKNGVLGHSWLKWFRLRNLHFVLRQPQSFDSNRAKALCL